MRSAFIVAVPLILMIATGRSDLGWSIFAAFWICLAEIAGPERSWRALLFGFVALGGITALVTSSIAYQGAVAALLAGPALVAMLLGVVAVVATGYPRPPTGAAMLALSFLLGGG